MRSPLLLLGATASLAAVGCGVTATSDAPDAEATQATTTAIVVVERTTSPSDAVRGAVVARFVRVRGAVDDSALRLAGVAQDLPPVGSCSAAPTEPSNVSPRAIDLLDVGAVTVDEATLGQRVMPDPAGIVSGVFYARTANEAFLPGSRLTLRASGGHDLPDAFTASVPAPRDLLDVRVAPVPGALDVSWDASEATPFDRVYIDVLGPSSRLLTRCTSTDAGHATIPSLGLGDEGVVAVHRVHVEPFAAKGVDRGEVRFDVARVVAFRR